MEGLREGTMFPRVCAWKLKEPAQMDHVEEDHLRKIFWPNMGMSNKGIFYEKYLRSKRKKGTGEHKHGKAGVQQADFKID